MASITRIAIAIHDRFILFTQPADGLEHGQLPLRNQFELVLDVADGLIDAPAVCLGRGLDTGEARLVGLQRRAHRRDPPEGKTLRDCYESDHHGNNR